MGKQEGVLWLNFSSVLEPFSVCLYGSEEKNWMSSTNFTNCHRSKNIIVLHIYVKWALKIVTPDVLWWRLYNLSSIRQRNVIKAHLAWEEKSVNRKRVHAVHAKWIEQAMLEDLDFGMCVHIYTHTSPQTDLPRLVWKAWSFIQPPTSSSTSGKISLFQQILKDWGSTFYLYIIKDLLIIRMSHFMLEVFAMDILVQPKMKNHSWCHCKPTRLSFSGGTQNETN